MVSRATANLLLGIVIGGCVVIVAERARRIKFDDDPAAIAKRMGRRIKTLESRVSDIASHQGSTTG